jgi:outer membrane protein assembly factor BamB
VAASALVVGAGLAAAAVLLTDRIPPAEERAAADEADLPVLTGRWPAFRGPTMMGIAPDGDWPTSWDAATGENILWRVPIPGQGHSSPVVWGRRVFVTTASQRERWVHCVDAARGRLAWSRRVASPPESAAIDAGLEVFDMTGFAAPTPVTDGEHVWATFADADLVCFTADGRQVWVRNLGKPDSMYGLASSLVLHGDLLILQLDQGTDPEAGVSALVAFDKATGAEAWRTPRPVPNSWSTPVVMTPEQGLPRAILVTTGNPFVMAYDPSSGVELWRAEGLSGDIAPMPVLTGGLIVAANTDSQAMAVRPGGSGNVTGSHVVWTQWEVSLPDMVSPVATDTHVLLATSYGSASGLRASDGQLLWEYEFRTELTASPVRSGDRVYLPAVDGRTFLFRRGDTFELEAVCDIGEKQTASPALADGRIYMRTEKHLVCIANGVAPKASASAEPAAGESDER